MLCDQKREQPCRIYVVVLGEYCRVSLWFLQQCEWLVVVVIHSAESCGEDTKPLAVLIVSHFCESNWWLRVCLFFGAFPAESEFLSLFS